MSHLELSLDCFSRSIATNIVIQNWLQHNYSLSTLCISINRINYVTCFTKVISLRFHFCLYYIYLEERFITTFSFLGFIESCFFGILIFLWRIGGGLMHFPQRIACFNCCGLVVVMNHENYLKTLHTTKIYILRNLLQATF